MAIEEVSRCRSRTVKVVDGRVAGDRGSEGGECRKDIGREGDRWQGVSGCWHVAGGQERASKWPRGWVASDDDRQRLCRKGLGGSLSYSPVFATRGAKPNHH